jgi:hypothetical protein
MFWSKLGIRFDCSKQCFGANWTLGWIALKKCFGPNWTLGLIALNNVLVQTGH